MSVDFPKEEEAVLQRWKEIQAFERQVELSKGRKPYTFYDGPPFATGLPHYGHLLASTIKDIIPRYWSMKGYHVERRFGWDTHGLPIEHEIDKKLGISGREAVMKLGLDKYNAECRAIVMRYSAEWRTTIDRLGRWIDFDNDYKTMDPTYMESVWWVFKQIFDKDAVYQGYRVMPYSTVLTTALSNFEANQNYQDIQDPAVVVSFPLLDDPETSLLAWTTTPWTLPSHTGLCAHPDFEYIKIRDELSGKNYILLEKLLGTLYKDPKKAKFKIIEKIKGSAMLGWKYQPLFDYFYEEFKDYGFRVFNATYVTDDSGVGIVHQAPAFGEEDYNLALEFGVIDKSRGPPNPLDETGHFTSKVRDFEGQHVKAADKAIIKYLKGTGRLIVDSQIKHSYPMCPRSDTPLIYRAVPSWFVKIPEIVPQMLENIQGSHWVPSFVKEKRFASWIANARDWNVSRNRYWGTPIPLWVSDDLEERVCIGSIAELKELSGYEGEITDLHRDKIDHITIPSKMGKGTLHRIEEVFDCWFESGSMPYASQHYPFENQDKFKASFPGDFIAEGLDQTRGWFYTLLVLGTHLFGKSPFQNCVVNGIVLAEDGKKMSKRLKNYPDPTIVMSKYGSDALRLYLINSPVVRAEPLRFKEAGVKEVVAKVLLPLWNSYKFFEGQVALLKKVEGVDFIFDPASESTNTNVMDQWILASCQSLLKFVNEEMAAYRLYTVVPRLLDLIDTTTNWYIRFNRKRLKGEFGLNDTMHALNSLFEVLFTLTKGLAPFTPFITDNIYGRLLPHIPKELRGADDRSVHFLPFPDVRNELFNEEVERRVGRMQRVIELARVSRERRAVGLKTPLKSLVVIHPDPVYLEDIRSLEGYITEELNVISLVLSSDEEKYNVQYSVSADWPVLGKKLKKDVQRVKKALPGLTSAEVQQFVIKKTITVDGIVLGDGDLHVKRSLKEDDSSKNLETNTDEDVLVILDAALYPELAEEGLSREIINRVQRLRKKAGLQPTDDVKMEYNILTDPDNLGLAEIFKTQAKSIEKALRRPVDQHVVTEVDGVATTNVEQLIMEEEQEIQKATFMLSKLAKKPELYYTNEDVAILYDIVLHAEELLGSLPESERIPTNALFQAYYAILPTIGINADHDNRYARVIFKVGGRRGGGSLYNKFEHVLSEMGIEIQFDQIDEEEGRHALHGVSEDSSFDMLPRSDSSLVGRPDGGHPRRRNSETSIWTIGSGKDNGILKRPRSNSLQSKPRPGLIDNNILESIWPPTTFPTSTLPDPHKPFGRDDNAHRVGSWLTTEVDTSGLSAAFQRTDSNQISQGRVISPRINTGGGGDTGSIPFDTDEQQPLAPISHNMDHLQETHVFPIPLAASRIHISAVIENRRVFFLHNRNRTVLLDKLACWRQKASEVLAGNSNLEALARSRDRYVLLKQGLETWVTALREGRRVLETERFFFHLERRAKRARDIFLLAKSFTHWATTASDEIQRTSVARRHILRTRFFKAWREITAVNELKVRRHIQNKFFGAWRRRQEFISSTSDYSIAVFRGNVVARVFWLWLWSSRERTAPAWWAKRATRRQMVSWTTKLRTIREMGAVGQYCRQEKSKRLIWGIWARKARDFTDMNDASLLMQKRTSCVTALRYLRNANTLLPSSRHIKSKVRYGLLVKLFNIWRLRTTQERQARDLDRHKIKREAWTAWNDRIRCQYLQLRISDRNLLQALYKWVLAERLILARRLSIQKMVRTTFERMLLTSARSAGIVSAGSLAALQFREQNDKRSIIRRWVSNLKVNRGLQQLAIQRNTYPVQTAMLKTWSRNMNELRQLQVWAIDANFYFAATKALKIWRDAAEASRREKRRTAYASVRRQNKLKLASRVLYTWRGRSKSVTNMENLASEFRGSRIHNHLVDTLARWRARKLEVSRLGSIRLPTILRIRFIQWKSASKEYYHLDVLASEFSEDHLYMACMRRWGRLALQYRAHQHLVSELHDKHARRAVRKMVLHWRQQLFDYEGSGSASLAGTKAVTNRNSNRFGFAERSEAFSDRGDVGLGYLTHRDESFLNPTPGRGYLKTPSKRTFMSRTANQASTTPIAPLSTPYERQLRAELSGRLFQSYSRISNDNPPNVSDGFEDLRDRQ
ncbi:hypothetical protein V492_01198 [Pseudogymnoascus sp. VKM F-4246]|nr:hypothetical protein V492_01198 [Pseudogymnoascus sp. VKM F-4246]